MSSLRFRVSMPRFLVITAAVLGVLAHAVWGLVSTRARRWLPRLVRGTLEQLGPPFVKLGKARSPQLRSRRCITRACSMGPR
jgi:hypothetical protein